MSERTFEGIAGGLLTEVHYRSTFLYQPAGYPGQITLYLAADADWWVQDRVVSGWRHLAGGGLEVVEVPGEHDDLLATPVAVAAHMRAALDATAEPPPVSAWLNHRSAHLYRTSTL